MMKKILCALVLAVGMQGCSQPEQNASERENQAINAEAERIIKYAETVGYQLLSADRDQVPLINESLIVKTNQQISTIHQLSGVDEMSIADMALAGANLIRKERPNIRISSLDILDVLGAVLPEQKDDLAADSINNKKLIASNISHYGVMRLSMQHKEAKDSFVALLKEMKSPDFAQRMNDYMNSQQ